MCLNVFEPHAPVAIFNKVFPNTGGSRRVLRHFGRAIEAIFKKKKTANNVAGFSNDDKNIKFWTFEAGISW